MKRLSLVAVAGALALTLLPSVALAKTATAQDRHHMAQSIADYIADAQQGHYVNEFRASKVDVGAATIVWPWALADWRASDGSHGGQVSFRYLCDHWNVQVVKAGSIPSSELYRSSVSQGMTRTIAGQLVNELAALEATQVAFVHPPKPMQGC